MIALLLILLPISVRAEGVFLVEKKLLVLSVFFFGLKFIRIKALLTDDGIFLSLNGGKGKPIRKKKKQSKKKKGMKLSFLDAIYIQRLDISLCAGGEPTAASLGLGATMNLIDSAMMYVERKKRLDYCRIRVVPSYGEERGTVKFSITLFTSGAFLIGALAHTTKGDNYAKRSNRKYYGQNDK